MPTGRCWRFSKPCGNDEATAVLVGAYDIGLNVFYINEGVASMTMGGDTGL